MRIPMRWRTATRRRRSSRASAASGTNKLSALGCQLSALRRLSALAPRRPMPRVPALIDDERSRSGRQNLKRLQELDDGILLVLRQSFERQTGRSGFAVMGLDGLPQRRELAVMEE